MFALLSNPSPTIRSKTVFVAWLTAIASPLFAATALEPTHRDVAYGPLAEQTLDFWKAESKGTTTSDSEAARPLLVYIHGGGWRGGDKKLIEKHRATYLEFSAINHVTADDPALMMIYKNDMTVPSKNAGHGIHHPIFGVKMKQRCDAEGVECHLLIPDVSNSKKFTKPYEFLVAKLKPQE